jgi:hypothetical protein
LLLNRLDFSLINPVEVGRSEIPVKKRQRNPIRNFKELESQIEDIYYNEYPPPPVSQIEKRLNYHNIRRKFPELSIKISNKYFEYRQTQKEINQLIRIEEVKTIMKELHNNFQYPTLYLVQKKMRNPSAVRDPIIRDVYKKTLGELGLL